MQPAHQAGVTPPAASDWERHRCPQTQKVFWYNRRTGKRDWERFPGDPNPDWEQQRDPKTNKFYWYNRVTQESRWDPPPAPPAPPGPVLHSPGMSAHAGAQPQWAPQNAGPPPPLTQQPLSPYPTGVPVSRPVSTPPPSVQGRPCALGAVHRAIGEPERKDHCHICGQRLHTLQRYKCRVCEWRSCKGHTNILETSGLGKGVYMCSRCDLRVVVKDNLGQPREIDRLEALLPHGMRSGQRIVLADGREGTILGAMERRPFWYQKGSQGAAELELPQGCPPPQVTAENCFPPGYAHRPEHIQRLLRDHKHSTEPAGFPEAASGLSAAGPSSGRTSHHDPQSGISSHAPSPYADPAPASGLANPYAQTGCKTPVPPGSPPPHSPTTATPGTPAADPDSELGQVDARGYLREKLLGGGAQGNVYLCKKMSTGEIFAVKDIVVLSADAPAKLATLCGQRDMLACGTHVVRYHDAWETPLGRGRSKVSVVMDYSAEGDLGRFIRNAGDALDEVKVLSLATQVASALAHMHSRSPPVIHMDVKPENILLFTEKGETVAKLTDFDASKDLASTMARLEDGEEQETTTAYTAPEVLEQGRFSTACDVFSLGVVFFCLAAFPDFPLLEDRLFNDPHWRAADELERAVRDALSRRVYACRPPGGGMEMRAYTPQLISIITRMLCYDYRRRPTLGELKREIQDLYGALLTGEVVPEVRQRFD
eukprot:TRINITY_DN1039_c0_g2_i1.p1 TRINITY_DN1039_c0_g2~~TRINITY_DN1039_c0_g2_i1.p1  ORF type:complete len:711 (+),score=154.93 TRINITY_DN1039_c0_g2_i1:125-2257(+)